MRRIVLALFLLAVAGWATPTRAQWWDEGRPAQGFCRPWTCGGGGWARPGRVVLVPAERPWAGQNWAGQNWAGPGGFAGPRWGWRRWGWQGMAWRHWAARRWDVQREVRLRRVEAWRRWAAAAPRVEEPASRFVGWDRPPRAQDAASGAVRDAVPRRDTLARRTMRPPVEERRAMPPAEAAVALMPALPRAARPAVHAALPARVLAAAAMIRHPVPAPRREPAASAAPAVLRAPAPPARPANAALLRPHTTAALHRAVAAQHGGMRPAAVRPVVLRSQPAPASPAVPTLPAPAFTAPAAAAPRRCRAHCRPCRPMSRSRRSIERCAVQGRGAPAGTAASGSPARVARWSSSPSISAPTSSTMALTHSHSSSTTTAPSAP